MRRRHPVPSAGRSALAVLLALSFLAGWGPRVQCLLGSSCEPVRQDEPAAADCCCEAQSTGEHSESHDSDKAPCECGAPCCGVPAVTTGTMTPAPPFTSSDGKPHLSADDQTVGGVAPDPIFHPPRAA